MTNHKPIHILVDTSNSAGISPNQGEVDSAEMISNKPNRQWYVVRTEPRAEHIASAELSRAGFEVYSPRIKSVEFQNSHRDIPLFPGYIFLYCNLTEDAPTFKQTAPHVSGWVSFDGIVPSISKEIIDDLRVRLVDIDHGWGLWRRFQRGEKVQVVTGQMHEIAEIIEEPKSPQSRVRVLMEFMGRLVPTQVPWESLRPAGSEQLEKRRIPRRTRGKGRWIRGFGQRAMLVS